VTGRFREVEWEGDFECVLGLVVGGETRGFPDNAEMIVLEPNL
jgi:hypothetical protein